MKSSLLLVLILSVAPACADDLREDPHPGDTPDAGPSDPDAEPEPEPTGNISHTDNGDGTTTSVVDASDGAAWIYLDLSTGEETMPNAPASSNDWDLGFQRFNIKLNGGVSGQAGVEAAVVDAAMDSITAAPAGGYVTDEQGTGEIVYAFGEWYDYDPNTHVLTPKVRTYVVHAVEDTYYRVQILDYYDDAGTSGHLELRWGEVTAP